MRHLGFGAEPAISIHAPRVGSDWGLCRYPCSTRYFNPRSPCGERRTTQRHAQHDTTNFNPRSPCGERLKPLVIRRRHKVFQSTLPVWGATLRSSFTFAKTSDISIHAPRVGSDAERFIRYAENAEFQSTLPVWGATAKCTMTAKSDRHFNPRSPCGERHNPAKRKLERRIFQSTLPVWGATTEPNSLSNRTNRFQSTLPVWGATYSALHPSQLHSDFNPRSPCGERPLSSTTSNTCKSISIHAPRVGSDR